MARAPHPIFFVEERVGSRTRHLEGGWGSAFLMAVAFREEQHTNQATEPVYKKYRFTLKDTGRKLAKF